MPITYDLLATRPIPSNWTEIEAWIADHAPHLKGRKRSGLLALVNKARRLAGDPLFCLAAGPSRQVRRADGKPSPKPMPKTAATPAPPMLLRRPQACVFPKWADGDQPGSKPEFCDDPIQTGSVYCSTHHARCYTKMRVLTDDQRAEIALRLSLGRSAAVRAPIQVGQP